MLAFYFAALTPASIARAAQSPPVEPRAGVQDGAPPDADALYRKREDIASAKQAVEIYAARAAAPGGDFDAAWKHARGCYYLGTRGPEPERRSWLERGITAAELAARLQPAKPEGFYWQAANMGALAESFGLSQGLKYRGKIKDNLLIVLKMDPAWLQGSADRALGWWYHQVPGLFGGSEAKAEEHLRQSLRYNAQSTASLYFLGEVLLERGKKDEGRKILQDVIASPLDPDWEPEDRDFKKKAEARLKRIK
jgi:hypothetical protein